MFQFNEQNLQDTIEHLTHNDFEAFNNMLVPFKSVYQGIKKFESELPVSKRPTLSEAAWNKKLDEQLDIIKTELSKLHKEYVEIIVNPLTFNSLYKFIKDLLRKVSNPQLICILTAENIAIYKQWHKDVNDISFFQEKDFNTFLLNILNTERQFAQEYRLLLGRLLTCAVRLCSIYLDTKFKQHGIIIEQTDTPESISKKASTCEQKSKSESKEKSDLTLKKLMIEFNSMCDLNMAPTYLESFKQQTLCFEIFKELAEKIDSHLKEKHPGITRINYLQQIFDPITFYKLGYCNHDIQQWLLCSQEYHQQNLKRKSDLPETLTQYRDLHQIDYTSSTERLKLLSTQPETNQRFFIGPYTNRYHQVNTDAENTLFQPLFDNLVRFFEENNIKRVKIHFGKNTSAGHAIGIMQLERGQGFIVRDVNQGTFHLSNISGLITWLPVFFTMMGYVDFEYYNFHYLPNENISSTKDAVYELARDNAQRLMHNKQRVALDVKPVSEYLDVIDKIGSSSEEEFRYLTILSGIKVALMMEKFTLGLYSLSSKIQKHYAENLIVADSNISENIETEYFEEDLDIEIITDLQKSMPEEHAKLCILEHVLFEIFGIENYVERTRALCKFALTNARFLLSTTNMEIKSLSEALSKINSEGDSSSEDNELKLQTWWITKFPICMLSEARAVQITLSMEICASKDQRTIREHEISDVLFKYSALKTSTRSLIAEYAREQTSNQLNNYYHISGPKQS